MPWKIGRITDLFPKTCASDHSKNGRSPKEQKSPVRSSNNFHYESTGQVPKLLFLWLLLVALTE